VKVGVILGDQIPQAGGGYTFQTDVFEHLPAALRKSSGKHSVVVFCSAAWIKRYAHLPTFSDFEFVEYQRSSIINLVLMELRQYFPWLRRFASVQSNLESAMLKKGVQIGWYVSPGGRPLDIPYIATVWDLMHLTHPWFPEVSSGGEWNAREAMYEQLLRRATYVITGTEVGRDEIAGLYKVPVERIRILPHPSPKFPSLEDGAVERVMREYDICGAYLLYPAQFWAHKNHVILLKALRLLNQERTETRFKLVLVGGDKGNFEYVKKIASELDVMRDVFFLGFVSVEVLMALYQRAFALVYPSFCGPENMPPLEAFSAEVPVVAADIPGSREQLASAALLVDPSSPEDFVDAINKLERDEILRQRLVRDGLARARRWTGENFVNGVVDIFNEFEKIRSAWI
jgi:glycosyltransferase involved in cell wall biosynthesis